MKSLVLILILFLSVNNIYALVDYSGSSLIQKKRTSKRNKISNRQEKTSKSKYKVQKKTAAEDYFISLGSKFESLSVDSSLSKSNVLIYDLFLDFKTPFDTSFLVHYLNLSSDSILLSPTTTSLQEGDLGVDMVFNWLRLGTGSNATAINLIFGIKTALEQSDYTSGRTDKIVGFETTKRFYNFLLSFNYRYSFAGEVDSDQKLSIGNIQTVTAKLGWRATSDIVFQLEGGTTKILKPGNTGGSLQLSSDESIGYISSKLNLGLSRFVELELGASFRTKEAKNIDELLMAGLWDIPYLYGNSLFASFIFSI